MFAFLIWYLIGFIASALFIYKIDVFLDDPDLKKKEITLFDVIWVLLLSFGGPLTVFVLLLMFVMFKVIDLLGKSDKIIIYRKKK